MLKLNYLLLATLAWANAAASESELSVQQFDKQQPSQYQNLTSNTAPSIMDKLAKPKLRDLEEYTETFFNDISDAIEQDYLKNLEQQFSVRITSR